MAKRRLTQIVVGGDETRFEKSNEVLTDIYNKLMDGLENFDEKAIKKATITLMVSFLEGKIKLDFLSFTASAFINRWLVDDKYKDFEFKDKVLDDIFGELPVLEDGTLEDAKKKVKELLEKLKKNKEK